MEQPGGQGLPRVHGLAGSPRRLFSSLGAPPRLYFMDIFLGDPLEEALAELKAAGCRIYCAEDHFSEAVAPHGDQSWALIVGHEELGVSKGCVEASDQRICVPCTGGESLNVAHAAAICLYELGKRGLERCARSHSGWKWPEKRCLKRSAP